MYGFLGESTSRSKIEVIRLAEDMTMRCAHSLTIATVLSDATGSIMFHKGEPVPVVCGGINSFTQVVNQMCYSLSDPFEQYSGPMLSPRVGAASLVIDDGRTLWVTGGYSDSTIYKTTSYTQIGGSNSTLASVGSGEDLIFSRRYHCMAKIDQSTAILLGGKSKDGKFQYMTWSIDINVMEWRPKMSLNTGRSRHVCGVLKDLSLPDMKYVIAAGGEASDGIVTDTVEVVIVPENGSNFHSNFAPWEYGPKLPEAISNPVGSTTGNQSKILVIGGSTSSEHPAVLGTSSVYVMSCSALQCQWGKLDYEISRPDANNGLALMLPPTNPMEVRSSQFECKAVNMYRGALKRRSN